MLLLWFCVNDVQLAKIRKRRNFFLIPLISFVLLYRTDSFRVTFCSWLWYELLWNDAHTSYKSLRRVCMGQERPRLQGHHALPKLSRYRNELHDWTGDVCKIKAKSWTRTGLEILTERVSLPNITAGRAATQVHGTSYFSLYKMQERFYRTGLWRDTFVKKLASCERECMRNPKSQGWHD